VAGVGGVSLIPEETSNLLLLGLGAASNNIVEAYALFQGLKLAREKKINKLTAFKDSMIVASAVIHQTQTGTNLFNGIISQVIELSKEFEAFQLYHVK
jgi:ribonuclease HI